MGRPLAKRDRGNRDRCQRARAAARAAGPDRPRRVRAAHHPDRVADELAAAADLVMGKLERAPAALIRGFEAQGDGSAARADPRVRARPLPLAGRLARASSGVSTSSASPGRSTSTAGNPAAAARCRCSWALAASPKFGASAVAGATHSALVPPSCARATTTAPGRRAVAQRPQLGGGQQRQVAGQVQHGVRRRVERAQACTSPLVPGQSAVVLVPHSRARPASSTAPGSELASVTGPISASRAAAATCSSMAASVPAGASAVELPGPAGVLRVVEPFQPDQHGDRHGRHGRARRVECRPVITLGYKASAEQFGPVELLDSRCGRADGFDWSPISDHFQPFRHTGGHAPAALPWLGALAAASERIRIGTSVLHADHALPSLDGRPGVRDPRLLAPGRVFLGVGTGESMNEVPPLGIEWPGFEERLAPAGGGDRADPAAVDARSGSASRASTTAPSGPRCTTARTMPIADPDRRRRPAGGAVRRPGRRRLHHHQRQAGRAVHRDAAAGGRARAPPRRGATPRRWSRCSR